MKPSTEWLLATLAAHGYAANVTSVTVRYIQRYGWGEGSFLGGVAAGQSLGKAEIVPIDDLDWDSQCHYGRDGTDPGTPGSVIVWVPPEYWSYQLMAPDGDWGPPL